MENARRLIVLYETEMVPKARASLNTAETWFREGKGSLGDFLELQSALYNFELSLARARADYLKALASLEALTGVSLDDQPMNEEAR